jgi:cardiolipin synthase A/B
MASARLEVDGHHVTVLRDGLDTYPAMLGATRAAQKRISVETYILCDDTNGTHFFEAWMERARAGVEVRVLYDDWGSKISDAMLTKARAAGVQLQPFRPVRFRGAGAGLLAQLRRRNHRKSMVLDGTVAFTGGLNLSDSYAAKIHGGKGWRDTHVRIEGPAAQRLESLFCESWNAEALVPLLLSARAPSDLKAISFLTNDFALSKKRVRQAYVKAIEGARKTIFLTNAYFLPPSRVLGSLVRASSRGVRTAVILGASTDVKMIWYAAQGMYPKLLKAGIEVYEWHGVAPEVPEGRNLHAKTGTIDGRWSTIGSTNLDAISLRQNLEVNAVFESQIVAQHLESLFLDDLQYCQRVTLEGLKKRSVATRFISFLAWQFRRWL